MAIAAHHPVRPPEEKQEYLPFYDHSAGFSYGGWQSVVYALELVVWSSFLALMILIAGRATREISEFSAPVAEAQVEHIFVATQRAPEETRGLFGAKRPRAMNYGLVEVSIPPTHTLDQIEWGREKPDPRRHFAATDLKVFEGVSQLRSALKNEPPGPYSVTNVYVHGFNTSVHKAVFRLAQIKHDCRYAVCPRLQRT